MIYIFLEIWTITDNSSLNTLVEAQCNCVLQPPPVTYAPVLNVIRDLSH